MWTMLCIRQNNYSKILFKCLSVSDLFQIAQHWQGCEAHRLTNNRNLSRQLLV